MAMSNALPRKKHITKVRKAVNERPVAPSGSEYPLGGFGGGKVVDNGRVTKAMDWKNR
jgi:hypothetical protein